MGNGTRKDRRLITVLAILGTMAILLISPLQFVSGSSDDSFEITHKKYVRQSTEPPVTRPRRVVPAPPIDAQRTKPIPPSKTEESEPEPAAPMAKKDTDTGKGPEIR